MAVVDNGSQGAVVNGAGAGGDQNHHQDQPKNDGNNNSNLVVDSDGLYMKVHSFESHLSSNNHQFSSQVPQPLDDHQSMKNGEVEVNDDDEDDDGGEEAFNSEMRELEEMFSKLNPMAEEFVPLSLAKNGGLFPNNTNPGRRKRSYNQGKRRMNARTSLAQREEVIRRTVYVSDIDHQITEEQLAALFLSCGQVVDCRVCGDPKSILRFAFIEFTDEEGAHAALSLSGTVLGYYPLRVLPSKTAIAPVNPTFLPRTEDEREMCARTVYCTNIDKKVSQADVKLFFETICGEVYRLRLLGDYHHSTRIAFVEFAMAESAIAALSCSGVVLGSLPIRVSPSKTPVRPRSPRPQMHGINIASAD
nr:polyadenylate-binding protein-interacting protein 11 isoform X1 [Ipomoea batatas]